MPSPDSSSNDSGGAGIERDSAGITIFESHAPSWERESAWTVDTIPSLELGSRGGSGSLLYGIQQTLRLRDGRIAVLSHQTQDIRIFDRAGNMVATLGRKGEGPGEFTALSLMAELPGDSILTVDAGRRRLAVFTSGGRLARENTYETPMGLLGPELIARFGDRRILGVGYVLGDQQSLSGSGTDDMYRFFVLSDSGVLEAIVGDFVLERSAPGGGVVGFAARAQYTVSGDTLYFGSGAELEIRSYDQAGSLLRIARVERPLQPVTEADRKEYLDSVNAMLSRSTAGGARLERERQRAIPREFSSFHPAHGRLVAGAMNTLWIAEPGDPFRTQRDAWLVLDADGRFLGSVRTPPGLIVDQIGDDFVLGRWTDTMGVERVRLHALRRHFRSYER